MNSRIPLIAAVVGALLVGGATTGSTRASWTDQEHLRGSSVTSGRMSYTATSPSGVTVEKQASSTADTTFVLDDTSLGKNIAQRITASVATVPTGVTATIGTTCPGAASVSVDMTPTSPDRTLCVRVTSSTAAVSGNVTINLSSAQRPTAGWTTPGITRTVAVTVNQPVVTPSAPQVSQATSCVGRKSDNQYTIAWGASATGSPTSYRVHRATSSSGPFADQGAATSPYDASIPDNGTTYWRVTAVNAAGSSVASNTIVITRNKTTGTAVFTCQVTTP